MQTKKPKTEKSKSEKSKTRKSKPRNWKYTWRTHYRNHYYICFWQWCWWTGIFWTLVTYYIYQKNVCLVTNGFRISLILMKFLCYFVIFYCKDQGSSANIPTTPPGPSRTPVPTVTTPQATLALSHGTPHPPELGMSAMDGASQLAKLAEGKFLNLESC